ncbi:hypothetical protein A2870_03565 [Candidatus Curtissbacteria bacterium RIFCSPHIGHO2_01_FULL_41_11]|uniref:Uncharacterized protein n=1 Tax=Candidatus Curtissbacteria bacterium RIFCSPHIGHO2_01_FULL_41_11 TaxID=1797711 RepID=A0A1F5G5N8_9BACT|nr:MAG: hypothetical protein A2870_03565 [Candidatus Curtissbacteria bacterium RIFCSPHIGHO2_01_FULL_41_11]
MAERQFPFNIPEEDWVSLHQRRVETLRRLEAFLQSQVASDEALTFLYEKMEDLKRLSENPTDGQKRPKAVGLLSISSRGQKTYQIEQREEEHSPETLNVAATLFTLLNIHKIDAVMRPNIDQIVSKALFLSIDKQAQVIAGDGRKIRFPSQVPGFAATIHFTTLDSRPRSVIIEPALKI